MKKKDQHFYILCKLWDEEKISSQKLREFCIQKGIVESKEEFDGLLEELLKKQEITCKDGMIKVVISYNDYKAKGFDAFSQTFINGGSKDKMIFTPPNTNITLR